MRTLILTTASALMLATSSFAATVACDPAAAYHPMVTDGNGTVYEASYFNNPTCAIGEQENRIANGVAADENGDGIPDGFGGDTETK